MSRRDLARRTRVKICFAGTDITESILPYFLSLTYTDNQEDEADDLQIALQDTGSIWLKEWLNEIVDAAVSASAPENSGLEVRAVIVRENWNGDGAEDALETGTFTLDQVDYSGPPAIVKICSTSLPFTAQVRQSKKTKGWEMYKLSGIANEIATAAGMACLYLTTADPYYSRVEQYQISDIDFLMQLCHDAGFSLKATNGSIVIFNQADYESKDGVRTVVNGDGSYIKYKLVVSTADVQYQSCRVFYNNPAGTSIEATAYDATYDKSRADHQQLNVSRRVSSIGEAKELAEKLLRLHNKYARKVQFTFPGDPTLLAGLNIALSGWGGWDGKYSITKAVHSVGASGYTTTITARKVLDDAANGTPDETAKRKYNVGDIVTFHGGYHYVSSTARSPTGGTRSSGPAKITYNNPGSAHPYHLVGGAYSKLGGSCNVYGWVDQGTFH